MKYLTGLGLLLILMTAAAAQEVAQPETVTVPWGQWVTHGIDLLLPAVLTALTSVATYVVGAYVPPWLRALAGERGQQRVNQVLTKAVQSAMAQTKGAIGGKALTITVANDVLRRAMQYAVDQAPKLIGEAAHGKTDNLMKMVMARMEEAGITPIAYSVQAAEEAVQPEAQPDLPKKGAGSKTVSGKFDFDEAISKGMGG